MMVDTFEIFNKEIHAFWPDWNVIKRIGLGGQGEVYEAICEDSYIQRKAAIKKMTSLDIDLDTDIRCDSDTYIHELESYKRKKKDECMREVKIMHKLKGNNHFVSVEDYKIVEQSNPYEWNIYIRMELLTPFSIYKKNKLMNESDVIQLGIEICDALAICSQEKIIHRDIKPDNILVDMKDTVSYKLGDFGTARLMDSTIQTMSHKGTYGYVAPEVVNCSRYDSRVDIYSLGLMLYQLLNKNCLPFIEKEEDMYNPRKREYASYRRLAGKEILPDPCQASYAMTNIIRKACAYQVQERYASANEMKHDLENLRDNKVELRIPSIPIQNKEAKVKEDKHDLKDYQNSYLYSQKRVNSFEIGNQENINPKFITLFMYIIMFVVLFVLTIAISIVISGRISKQDDNKITPNIHKPNTIMQDSE